MSIVSEQHDVNQIAIDEAALQAALRGLAGPQGWDAAEYGITAEQAAAQLRAADTPEARQRVLADLRRRAIQRANLDASNGRIAVMVAGEPAWHRLGVNVSEAQTSEQAVRLAGLDWQVAKWRLFASNPVDGTSVAVDDAFAVTRTDTGAPLGVVGSNYRPFQNAEAFDFMDALVDDRLAMYETAGAIKGGRRVWMLARIPKELRAAGQDVVHPYVLLTNSHDGTSALRMIPTSVRVVCENTQNLALRRAGSQGFTIRHCETLDARVQEARANLGIIFKRLDTFEEEIQALARVSLSSTEVKDYFRTVFPPPPRRAPAGSDGAALLDSILGQHDARAQVTRALLREHEETLSRAEKNNAKLLEQMLANYESETARGTAWGAYNAVSQWTDHQSRVTGRTTREKDDNRLNSIWFGRGDEVKQQAYRAALELVGR